MAHAGRKKRARAVFDGSLGPAQLGVRFFVGFTTKVGPSAADLLLKPGLSPCPRDALPRHAPCFCLFGPNP
jgi:hypothetical protein